MRRNRMWKKVLLSCLTAALLLSTSVTTAFAEEEGVLQEEEAGGEEAGGEETGDGAAEGEEGGDGEAAAEGEAAPSGGGAVGTIATNIEGKYLSETIPEAELPSGFSITTVPYGGTNVQIATRTSRSSEHIDAGAVAPITVTIAYLTNEDGSGGDFYLCDTTDGAKMSDMIKIDGKEGRYIIVLDPGDNVVGPNNFRKMALMTAEGKKATAWKLPKLNSSEEEESGASESASLFTVTAYADDFTIGVGAGADTSGESPAAEAEPAAGGDEAPAPEDGEAPNTQDGEAPAQPEAAEESADPGMLTRDEIQHTNQAGLVQAQPEEFCLLYAIDQDGNLGFYLYDTAQDSYQRYVDIPKGDSEALVKYKNLSRTRLLIMIVLAVLLVILLFVLLHMILGRKKRRAYDLMDDDEDAMRERVVKKEQKRIRTDRRGFGYEDDYYEDYAEDEEPYEDESYEEDVEEEDYPEDQEDEEEYGFSGDPMPIERNRAEEEVDWENVEVTAEPVSRGRRSSGRANVQPDKGRYQDEDYEDRVPEERPRRGGRRAPVEDGDEYSKGSGQRKSRGHQGAGAGRKGQQEAPRGKRPDYDLDGDFDFEFLNLK
ncbi:MAG: hypothetical protein K5989_04925 [Lachnospiraceae bacterium]|nr:hypothetical protein [Lachnospiraceae bacterium]